MRAIVVTLGIAAIGFGAAGISLAGDLMFGCMGRPACGKVCKLVCGTTTLTAVGYGCECAEICIPGPSRPGCKHCDTTCCCDNDIAGCPPKIEFCWYDWFACGCAKPRSIRVLTKYQAEKEVCSYHWEVVDGCDCGCDGCAANGEGGGAGCRCVYKPAPAEAEIGDVLKLSEDEQVRLASWMSAEQQDPTATPVEPAAASGAASTAQADGAKSSAWQRMAKLWRVSDGRQ